MATEGVRYIKIARIDKNGINQTNTLQSLNQITIPYTSGDIVYTVVNITEKPTFFLYYVNPAEVDWSDRADIKYDFTGSLTSEFNPVGKPPVAAVIGINVETDNLNFLVDKIAIGSNQLKGSFYKIDTYPQKPIYFRTSGSISLVDVGVGVSSYIIALNRSNQTYPDRNSILDSTTIASSSFTTQSFDLSYSEPSNNSVQPGDNYYLTIGGSLTSDIQSVSLTSDSYFHVTSSNATNNQVGLIAEPYFGSNDFNRALDCQPLLNNAERVRKHNLYQDVDYSAGATEPVNFDLLISGSAVRADVQFSNYTTRRHVIPRYEGSKSTSKNLNRWTPGDKGTFGKTPTLESLKTVIAYCDWIGTWPPDRMNASTAHILYLIDSDGNIGVPNTSENSLPNIQGAFQTGERFRISSRTIGSGEPDPLRTVIRGGTRIEPILYTQSGSNPGAQYTDIELVDIKITEGSATGDYQANGFIPLSIQGTTGSPPGAAAYFVTQRLRLNPQTTYISPIQDGPYGESYNYYQVPLGVIQENITLNFSLTNLTFKWIYLNTFDITTSITLGVILKRNNDTVGLTQILIAPDQPISPNLPPSSVNPLATATIPNVSISIPASELNENDELSFELQADKNNGNWFTGLEGIQVQTTSNFSITQTPIPTSIISPSDPSTDLSSSIWGYYDKTNYPYVITSSNEVSESLGVLYGDPNVKQKDVTNSGFNPIALPWSIKYGDEFRFEGDERFTYMVKDVYGPNEGSGSRITPTGSIEVQFDKDLPVSANFNSFNLDYFLIRRYVDDPSQIIFEGEKPLNSQGPYIITPEYSTAELNTNIDDVITNLKERGLITGEEGS